MRLLRRGLRLPVAMRHQKSLLRLSVLMAHRGGSNSLVSTIMAAVFVDYAHKPDALEKVLAALRPLTRGRLILVFGCGGDRDRGKRPIMGEIAGREADIAIVTDDNPRSEDAAAIRAAILESARGSRAQIFEIGDRAAAIGQGVALLKTGDVLLVAGKGHETGQIIGSKVLPFSDRDAVLDAIQNAGKKNQCR